tara:strand:+ start:523 stop:627 length:105 start_codon:yes stop_codon:yes gene_type:complete
MKLVDAVLRTVVVEAVVVDGVDTDQESLPVDLEL